MSQSPKGPSSVSELTPEWLIETVAGALGVPADPATNRSDVTLMSLGEGMGETGSLMRAEFRGYEGLPSSVIVKLPSSDRKRREQAMSIRLYEREARFYRELSPGLGASVPDCYFADYDEGGVCLILEDLPRHRPGDEVRGAEPGEAALVLEAIAPVHARYWGKTDAPELAWVPRHDGPLAPLRRESLERGWTVMAETFHEQLPAVVHELRSTYLEAFPRLQHLMASEPATLVHGDLRLDNVLFGEPGPDEVVLLDWQGLLVGRAMQDVAYLVSHCMETEDRREHEGWLLRRYTDALAGSGVAYAPEDLERHYRQAMLFIFSYVVGITGSMQNSNPRAMARKRKLVVRACEAMDDWCGWDLLKELGKDGSAR